MSKKHFLSVDYLRAIAIFAVVAIHTSTQTFAASGFNANEYTFSIFINQTMRFAVPLFFAISGFSLALNYASGNYFVFVKKRLTKILIPYTFWSFFYYFLIYTGSSEAFLKTFIKGTASYQLYFIPALLLLYLLFPFVYKFFGIITNKLVFSVLLIAELYLLYHEYFVKPLLLNHSVKIALLNFVIFLLGIWTAKNYEQLKRLVGKYKYLFLMGSLFLALYVFFEGSGLFKVSGNYLDIYSQWRPSIFFYTIFVGSFLFYLFEKSDFKSKLLENTSGLSFFIFFSHIAILELFWKYVGQYYFHYPFFDLLFLAFVFLTSLVCGQIVHKFPKLKILTG